MINLLPQNEKLLIEKEYRLRLKTIGVVFVLVALIVGIVFLLPSYVLSIYREGAAAQVAKDGVQSSKHEKITKEVQDLKIVLGVLAPDAIKASPTDIVTLITKHISADIKVTSISYISDKTGFKVTVRGLAKSRQSLATYTQDLEGEQLIDKVNLPVSNFAKDSNINFTLDFTIKS
jgi:Tfp pilus assembly protein PilN